MNFDGEGPSERLDKQHETIRDLMLDGEWRTLGQIAIATGFPHASISAQLRHLRKERFGSYQVHKRNEGSGLWTYQVEAPIETGQGKLL